MQSMGGERSLCARDEDSISMAVEAGCDCLSGLNPKEIDAVYFATVSSPFKQKQAAGILAAALDIRKDAYTIDFAGSTRAMTQAVKAASDAVKAGSANKVLVVGSDHRVARPGSQYEQLFGDGAVALLIGNEDLIAEIEGFATLYEPIIGPWQTQEDKYLRAYEPKIDTLGITLGDLPGAMQTLLGQCNLNCEDIAKFALPALEAKSYKELVKAIGFDPKVQMDDPLVSSIGMIGTPHSSLLLISALEKADPKERILCASEGDGADAFLIRTTDQINGIRHRHRGTGYIASKKNLTSYGLFGEWQGTRDVARNTDMTASVVTYSRDGKSALPFYGTKCNQCGSIQYPIRRACEKCRVMDDYKEVQIAMRGTIFTFTHDYLYAHGTIPGDGLTPYTRAVADMDDGCRLFLELVDCEFDEVKIGATVERTFRHLHTKQGYRYYGWRARPVRM
jgi:3-hydroxy-3-methylglutaryl CoA synthase